MSLRRWSIDQWLAERKWPQWMVRSFSPTLQVLEEAGVMVRPSSLPRTLARRHYSPS